MIGSKEILYSMKIRERANLVLIDGVVNKNRKDNSISLEEIIENRDNVVVQEGKKIKIYCSKDRDVEYYRKIRDELISNGIESAYNNIEIII